MASLLVSHLEEEARAALPLKGKRARRASQVLSAAAPPTAAAAIESIATKYFTAPPLGAAVQFPGALKIDPTEAPRGSPVPTGALPRLRAPRQVFLNVSRNEGNPFTAAPPQTPFAVEAALAPHSSNNNNNKRRQVGCSTSASTSRSNGKHGGSSSNFRSLYQNGDRGSSSLPADVAHRPRHTGNAGEGPLAEQGALKGTKRGSSKFSAMKERLPVWRYREEVEHKVKAHQVTLIIGETGSGKTTQVPQLLLQWGVCTTGWIVVSQPRRVAAVSLARRVSAEMGEPEVGGLVGYTVRFESRISSRTRIRFMTDGMLVREALVDPKLRRFSVLVLDEVHERALQTDFLLGLAKRLAVQRPELKVVLMSATMETERLRQFLPKAAVVSIPGNTFPVKTFYLPEPEEDFLEAAMLAVLQIHLGDEGPGDVLVFLPGQEEIETLASLLRSKLQLLETFVTKQRQEFGEGVEFSVRLGDEVYRHRSMKRLFICPIYSALPFDQQQQVLLPTPPRYSRKAVLATNIAEASLTVSGIRFVVDTGLRKAKARDHRTLAEALLLQEISQDSAKQRSGRAGREAPGSVYRLYTEECFQQMQAHRTPEILSCDLSQLFLQLKVLRVENPLAFPLLDAPPREAFASAGRQLYRLEAIDEQGNITSLGKQLASLPLPPQLGALLLASGSLNCEEAALTLTAMLSTDSVWSTPFNLSRGAAASLAKARKRFTDPQSDHLTLVGAYNHWAQADDPHAFCREAGLQQSALLRARVIRQQLQDALSKLEGRTTPSTAPLSLTNEHEDYHQQAVNLRRCLAKSCWQQAARLQEETRQFVTVVGRFLIDGVSTMSRSSQTQSRTSQEANVVVT